MLSEKTMSKHTLKVSDSDSSSIEESDSDNAVESGEEEVEGDDESIDSDNEKEEVESGKEEDEGDDESIDSANEKEEVESGEEEVEGDDESIDSDNEKEQSVLIASEGWGDSVAKILGTNKPKKKKTLVLSRAKKHSETVKAEKGEKPSFEVIGESSEIKPDVKTLKIEESVESPAKKVKQEKPSIRQKPNILEKDRERILSKIATKGVVQLFNAVRNQQKTLEKELNKDDVTELKKEKILKKIDKRTFLDTLMGKTKSVVVDEEAKSSLKDEVKDEQKPRWNALRDDFMMGAKMKDWDKVEEE